MPQHAGLRQKQDTPDRQFGQGIVQHVAHPSDTASLTRRTTVIAVADLREGAALA